MNQTAKQSLAPIGFVPSALAKYESARRSRVERVVEYGARFSGAKAPGTVSRIIRDLMLPFVFKRAASPKSMQSMSWLFNYHIEWTSRYTQRPEPMRRG
jgi:hypothetical protein